MSSHKRLKEGQQNGPAAQPGRSASTAIAAPTEVALDLIDQDPHQPRSESNPGFSAASIAELAASIRRRQVRTPISLRDNPAHPGRYLINHGARRFRASKVAGKATIPAFIDNDYNQVDQVMENLQRNELTAREIADYIGRELAKGKKKSEIAIAISKSPAFVTQHATLLDLPEPVAAVFCAGRVNDVTVINELVTIHKKWPREVSAWLANQGQDLTRGATKLLRAFLEEKSLVPGKGATALLPSVRRAAFRQASRPAPVRRPVMRVWHAGRLARIMLYRRPSRMGWGWIRYLDDGQEAEVPLSDVRLDALVEA